jgi:hypothetical protein
VNEQPQPVPPAAPGAGSRLVRLGRQPRVLLLGLAAWSALAAVTQLFVNSGVFLDIHDVELDGALGGFALSLNAVPLAVLYLYCFRDPGRFAHVFWLAFVHQAVMVAAVLYHLAIGTFSFESVVVPLTGSAVLGAFSFVQIFEPKAGAPAG